MSDAATLVTDASRSRAISGSTAVTTRPSIMTTKISSVSSGIRPRGGRSAVPAGVGASVSVPATGRAYPGRSRREPSSTTIASRAAGTPRTRMRR